MPSGRGTLRKAIATPSVPSQNGWRPSYETWLGLWVRRYGEAAVEALADELRSLPWRARGDVRVLEDAA